MIINFEEIIQGKLKEMQEEKVVENLISTALEIAIQKSVNEAIDSYAIKGKIESKLKKEVDKSLEFLDFGAYNKFMTEKISNLLKAAMNMDLSYKVEEMLNDFIKPKENILKLSQVLTEYRDMLMDEPYDEIEYGDKFGLVIDNQYSHASYIYVDEKQSRGSRRE